VINNLTGFTDSSGGWVEQTFDLSAYSGEKALFRFLYVTDWAYVETNFYVDDIMIADESGPLLEDDLESGNGNWLLEKREHTTGLAEND
jgi:immune inhibitor A